jgi:hypothetical protein
MLSLRGYVWSVDPRESWRMGYQSQQNAWLQATPVLRRRAIEMATQEIDTSSATSGRTGSITVGFSIANGDS